MQTPCDYQLALADLEGRQAMEQPTAWVPGLPLEMTVAAPASNSLVVSSSGQQQLKLVEQSSDHEYAVEVFKQAAESFKDKHDQMETKIHLFPASMEDLAAKYAAPKVVSIGPYHHGWTPALQQMESTKHVAAWHFIDDSDYTVEEVYGAVCEISDEARSRYDEDKVRDFSDDDFKPMMFYDGCFLLQFILHCSGGTVDSVLSDAFSSDDSGISRDVVLLENQLPWLVVETLMSFMPTPGLDLVKFTGNVKDSLQARQQLEEVPLVWDSDYTPPHLLGLLRYYIVGSTHVGTAQVKSKPLSDKAKKFSISVSAIELAEIGIAITATKSTEGLKEMGIRNKALLSGELCLAPVSLDDRNVSFLVNMAAFELCTTPNFFEDDEDKSTVCSYLGLLGMVTDGEQDVQELRKKHILQGGAGLTNEDALDLFISLEKHLRTGNTYLRIMLDIENYRIDRSVRTKVHRFGYKNRRTIAKVVTVIVGFAGFLGTLKSLK